MHEFDNLKSRILVYIGGSARCTPHYYLFLEWEEELQKELTDFEVVGDADDIDDAALEKEIMNEMSSSDLK